MLHRLFILVWKDTPNVACCPIDDSNVDDDPGMLIYRTRAGADAAAAEKTRLIGDEVGDVAVSRPLSDWMAENIKTTSQLAGSAELD